MTKLTRNDSAKTALRAIVGGMTPASPESRVPCAEEIEKLHAQLQASLLTTPMWDWDEPERVQRFGSNSRISFKLELFQRGGSFKTRGAYTVLQAHLDQARRCGAVAVSAGNHALAVARAASQLGITAELYMLAHARPERIAACRAYGAQVHLIDDAATAFELARGCARHRGMVFVHPFDGLHTIRGTATLGREIMVQRPDLDLVVVAIGGGGLAAGVALAVKQLRPQCRVVGVEPFGADSMFRSRALGRPVALDEVDTIADSLAAPHAEAYSFGLCESHVDELVRVDDDDLRRAMAWLTEHAKIAVEPAGAATTAALLGPLAASARDRRVCAIICGANLDAPSFVDLLGRYGRPSRERA